jgi:hypothetical protein
VGNFLTSETTTSFSRRILLHDITMLKIELNNSLFHASQTWNLLRYIKNKNSIKNKSLNYKVWATLFFIFLEESLNVAYLLFICLLIYLLFIHFKILIILLFYFVYYFMLFISCLFPARSSFFTS